MSSVATSTDGKSGGKLWLLAIASNASKQMRPHSGMSAAVMGRISRFTSFLSSRSGGTFTAVAGEDVQVDLKFHGGEARQRVRAVPPAAGGSALWG